MTAQTFDHITDPRQRAVASRVDEVCRIFSGMLAAWPIEERLRPPRKAESDAEKIANDGRKYAIGALIHLCRDLGVPAAERHGTGQYGRTQILALKEILPGTEVTYDRLFAALYEDDSDLGTLVRTRYGAILANAQEEVLQAERAAKSAPNGTATDAGTSKRRSVKPA